MRSARSVSLSAGDGDTDQREQAIYEGKSDLGLADYSTSALERVVGNLPGHLSEMVKDELEFRRR